MNEEQKKDIEFAAQAMALLQDAEEFALVARVPREDGKGLSTQVRITDGALIPYFRDELDLYYQEMRKERGDEE